MNDSPPPMIIQLRRLLTDMQIDPDTILRMIEDPGAYVMQIELCVELVDSLIMFHPVLTEGWLGVTIDASPETIRRNREALEE